MSGMSEQEPGQRTVPEGILSLRTMAMPGDTNAHGTIFGGWILARMDQAASIAGSQRARGRCMTVALNDMRFIRTVHVGNDVEIYCTLLKVGRSSMQFHTALWVHVQQDDSHVLCAEGVFVMVAINEDGQPRPVPEA
ncbi:acyl-CoA thioesterase [Acidomonas methanolica]|uniref:acyl-CoA thioesterase n=1 Tax=Acidomonas methanolica TaxID=437 RepID=UPI00211A6FB9|nr:acyl-CoA thioesterase [Acidomonas methanolica]MCQ9155328.1 acyl-CoA thioesterase [Acidomonas methanolica]